MQHDREWSKVYVAGVPSNVPSEGIPCIRDQEPDRTVPLAVEKDEIAPKRYLSYLNILASLRGEDVGR